MSSPVVGSKRRAPYTSMACNNCRRRRCKCDGLHPTCGTCLFYGHECNWTQEDSPQRPASKQLVESLRMRTRELEFEINRFKAEHTGDSGEKSNQEEQGTAFLSTTNESNEEYPRRSHLTLREGSISASGPTSMWSTFLDEPAPLREDRAPYPELIYRYIFQQNPSASLDSLSRDIRMSLQCEWNRHLPTIDADVRFTRLEHDTLLYNCFKYHNMWLRTLEPNLFLRDMLLGLLSDPSATNSESGDDLSYYSPFLHCALMALATTFSSNSAVRSKHVREQFANRAKQLLESECERPTLTAIQGLIFLSEYHGSLGERGLAYLYFGIGCRLIRALGLCINGDEFVKRKIITQQELSSRTWLFWALFCQDKLMSLEYGRDYDISLPHLNVALPTVDPIRDCDPWDPVDSGHNHEYAPQPNQSTLVFFEGCRLMLIAIRIMDTLYLQGRKQLGVTESDSISNIHKLLESWHDNLPTQIRVPSQSGAPALPHVVTLNIKYWWLLILLHRPFSLRTQSTFKVSGKSNPTTFADLSADVCEKAAESIVQLVVIFSHNYGSRFFPLYMLQAIFVAGVTLVARHATLSSSLNKQHTDARKMVQDCISALRGAAQTWEPARLYASRLERLLFEQTSWRSFNSQDANVHELIVPDNEDSLSQMFQDFIVPDDQKTEVLGIPIAVTQFEHPLLQQLNQQPQWGIPSGSEFMTNPNALPLSFDLPLDEEQFAGDTESFAPKI